MTPFLTSLLLAVSMSGGADATAAMPHAAMPHVALLQAPVRAVANAADPADSLYAAAREAMNRGDFRAAAQLFARVNARYPDSPVAGDALYWQAYALYRQGGTSELRAASKALKTHKQKYPKAATRGDADALATRIEGTLARQGDADAAEAVTGKANAAGRDTTCSNSSGDDDDDMRVAALNALMQMDADRALPVLKQVLARRDACSAALRRKAVFILSQKGGSEVVDMLLGVATNDPDLEVRSQAVFWMGQTRSDRAAAALDSIVRYGRDQRLREQAVFGLSQLGTERSSAALRRVAEDTTQTEDVREKAIFWLGQQRSSANAQYLRQLFDRTTSDELRGKIMFSLSQMRGEGNDVWLLGIVGNSKYSIETRKSALFSAGQNRVDSKELIALWPKLQEREMKEQLIWVMADRHEPELIDRLIEIAKTEKDVELRKKAIFWLGQSRDPRVQQLLLDIINQ